MTGKPTDQNEGDDAERRQWFQRIPRVEADTIEADAIEADTIDGEAAGGEPTGVRAKKTSKRKA